MNILVTGASGYIGGRLVPRLIAEGHHVTCLVRRPEKLHPWLQANVDIRQGDLLDPKSLLPALENIEVAYYLVHSMADGVNGYIERDHRAALNFGNAARQAGVQRIIYLGGLGSSEKSLAPHLEARQKVGEILRLAGVPVTEFRAAIVIGSGSMSFEMIRYLTERLPVLFTPSWINTLCQPISIDNVLDYLVLSLSEPRSIGVTYEIGGPDVLTYEQIMRGYASTRRLKRLLVNLPLLTPRILATGANIITPLPAPYLHILIEGLRSEVVVADPRAQEDFKVDLIPYRQALLSALECTENGEVKNYWQGGQAGLKPGRTHKIIEGMYIEQRQLETHASPEAVYATIAGLGGKDGWYYANWLWQLRGLLDRLVGGVGMRTKQESRQDIRPGDTVNGYTVEAVEAGWLIRLRNDMKSPGPAWMQFEVQRTSTGKTMLIQTAFFMPHGLAGVVYWQILYPFHQLIFNGLAKEIVRRAEAAYEQEVALPVSE